MNTNTICKKELQKAINSCIEKGLVEQSLNQNALNYKELVKEVAISEGITKYEVLTHVKALENEGAVRFYAMGKESREGVGMISETYRLKMEEQLGVSESDYFEGFLNEALILNLCR